MKKITWAMFVCLPVLAIQLTSCHEGEKKPSAGTPSIPAGVAGSALAEKQDKCGWIDSLANAYLHERKALADQRLIKNNKALDDQPLDAVFAEFYMKAFEDNLSRTWGRDATYTAKLDAKQLAFFISYLYTHQDESSSIQLSFGRYIKQLPIPLRDPAWDDVNNANKENRYTVIIGLTPDEMPARANPQARTKPYTVPFKDGRYAFYDDWHEIWP